MLQQTQVATALPYYERWMARFPTARSLAEATQEDALAMWQGLGYYRRCRMLQEGVRLAVANGWPESVAEWKAMPGVGDYSAAALASICLGAVVPVVDGNVERVFARVNASTLTGSNRREAARAWASSLISRERPADFNQAIMELGATVCKPTSPSCESCPISHSCQAFAARQVALYPVANPRPVVVEMSWPALVWLVEEHVACVRAQATEWWSEMYRFPRLDEVEVDAKLVGQAKHTVTRHRVTFPVYVRHDQTLSQRDSNLIWIPLADLDAIPLPSAMRKVWKVAAQAISNEVLIGGD